MNEAEFQNLQVSDILYMEGSSVPCVVTQVTPAVVVSATAVVDDKNFHKWNKPSRITATERSPVYKLAVTLIEVKPDGSEETVSEDVIDKEIPDKAAAEIIKQDASRFIHTA